MKILCCTFCLFFLFQARAQQELDYRVEEWPNGQPKLEMYLNPYGLRHGCMTTYYESGAKKSEGEFVDGLPHGPHIEWYESGLKKHEKHYHQGLLHGDVKWWFDTGQLRTSLHYENDHRTGPFREVLADGRVIEEGRILGYDTLRVLQPDSSIRPRSVPKMNRTRYYSNGLERDVLEYDPESGLSHWASWFRNGKKEEEGQYRYDYKVGKWLYWNRQGGLENVEVYDAREQGLAPNPQK